MVVGASAQDVVGVESNVVDPVRVFIQHADQPSVVISPDLDCLVLAGSVQQAFTAPLDVRDLRFDLENRHDDDGNDDNSNNDYYGD